MPAHVQAHTSVMQVIDCIGKNPTCQILISLLASAGILNMVYRFQQIFSQKCHILKLIAYLQKYIYVHVCPTLIWKILVLYYFYYKTVLMSWEMAVELYTPCIKWRLCSYCVWWLLTVSVSTHESRVTFANVSHMDHHSLNEALVKFVFTSGPWIHFFSTIVGGKGLLLFLHMNLCIHLLVWLSSLQSNLANGGSPALVKGILGAVVSQQMENHRLETCHSSCLQDYGSYWPYFNTAGELDCRLFLI